MSKHGRLIKCKCGAEFPVNRKNLKKSHQPGGFICPKCQREREYKSRKDKTRAGYR